MALGTIVFWGESIEQYGIPKTLYSYLITVSVNQVIGDRDKIVKITPLTENTPNPSKEYPFIIKNSDSKNAITTAFNLLKDMSSMQGMNNQYTITEDCFEPVKV